jgi:hypothetical protein
MNNNEQTKSEELQIQGLLDRYLRFRSSTIDPGAHLDEDSLSAFVEGRLARRESSMILRHLADCSFCLHVTGELAKLEMAFSGEPVTASAPAAEPTKISDVLSGLLSRIFGTQSDGAVFAHHESEENQETEKTEKEEDQKES